MSERFYAGGWRLRLAAFLALVLPASAGVQLAQPSGLAVGFSALATGALFAWGLLHRRRPVIEIGDDVLWFGSIYSARCRSVPVWEVVRVDLAGPRMDLTLRSGEVIALPAPELPRDQRRAAREAIERRTGGR